MHSLEYPLKLAVKYYSLDYPLTLAVTKHCMNNTLTFCHKQTFAKSSFKFSWEKLFTRFQFKCGGKTKQSLDYSLYLVVESHFLNHVVKRHHQITILSFKLGDNKQFPASYLKFDGKISWPFSYYFHVFYSTRYSGIVVQHEGCGEKTLVDECCAPTSSQVLTLM